MPRRVFPDLPRIGGVRFATVAAGVKYADRDDVMLAELTSGSAIAGVFTRSATRSAPVLDCQAKIGGSSDEGAAIIVNSGNANAFTGRNGTEATAIVTKAVAKALSLPEMRIFSASTGVIGEPLPHGRMTAKIAELQDKLSADDIASAAKAIMTTDTFPKGAGKTVDLAGSHCAYRRLRQRVGHDRARYGDHAGICLHRRAWISVRCCRRCWKRARTTTSFNAITVDSDTSTSDTVLVAATARLANISGVDVTGCSRRSHCD